MKTQYIFRLFFKLQMKNLWLSVENLFSLLNGDDMFATLYNLAPKSSSLTTRILWIIYIVSFVSLHIYAILALFLSILVETAKEVKEVNVPLNYFAHISKTLIPYINYLFSVLSVIHYAYSCKMCVRIEGVAIRTSPRFDALPIHVWQRVQTRESRRGHWANPPASPEHIRPIHLHFHPGHPNYPIHPGHPNHPGHVDLYDGVPCGWAKQTFPNDDLFVCGRTDRRLLSPVRVDYTRLLREVCQQCAGCVMTVFAATELLINPR